MHWQSVVYNGMAFYASLNYVMLRLGQGTKKEHCLLFLFQLLLPKSSKSGCVAVEFRCFHSDM